MPRRDVSATPSGRNPKAQFMFRVSGKILTQIKTGRTWTRWYNNNYRAAVNGSEWVCPSVRTMSLLPRM